MAIDFKRIMEDMPIILIASLVTLVSSKLYDTAIDQLLAEQGIVKLPTLILLAALYVIIILAIVMFLVWIFYRILK